MLDHAVEEPERSPRAVAGALLVGVLAVAQRLGSLQLQPDHRRQAVIGCPGAVGLGLVLVQPRAYGRVVSLGVSEGLAGQAATGGRRQAPAQPELIKHRRIVGRVDQHAHMGMVLGRGPHHRRSANVDRLDAGRRLERVQVHHHQIDRVDPVGLQVGPVGGVVAISEDPAVDAGMEGHHPMAQHDRRARVVGYVHHRQARGLDHPGRARTGDQLPPQLDEPRGQLDHARLVVDRDQRPRRCIHRGQSLQAGDDLHHQFAGLGGIVAHPRPSRSQRLHLGRGRALAPDTMAPAWPIFLPGGAVTPAM